jgi:hypothetical protein
MVLGWREENEKHVAQWALREIFNTAVKGGELLERRVGDVRVTVTPTSPVTSRRIRAEFAVTSPIIGPTETRGVLARDAMQEPSGEMVV